MLMQMRGVGAGYGRLPVLFGVDFDIDAGEMVAVVGANGAGKSTLLKTMLGLVPARKGEIAFRGRRVTHIGAAARFSQGISLSPEGRRIFKTLTVEENLLSGCYGTKQAVVERQMERCYTLFPRLLERRKQRAGSMSGGEQQMLAVSRALMSNPRLLLVDELSMGLAPLVVDALLDSLRELCNYGLAVVVVDQFAVRVLERADRACLMEKGRIVFEGAPDEIERVAGESVGLETVNPVGTTVAEQAAIEAVHEQTREKVTR